MSVVPPPPVPTSTEIVVEGRDLTKVYGSGDAEVRALDGVSIPFPRGQFTAVMGPSGSGKSTLMHCLAGLDTPTSGQVLIEGKDITDGVRRRADADPARQGRLHLPVLQPAADADRGGEHGAAARASPAATATRRGRTSWSTAVGLGDRLHHRPAELSGGQQQRVAVGPRAADAAGDHLRRRADRQPRLQDQRRGAGAAARTRWTSSARRS